MYLLIHYTLSAPPSEEAQLRAAMQQVFQGIAMTEAIPGLILAHPNTVSQTDRIIFELVSLEAAHDPMLALVVVQVPSGQWWLSTDALADLPLATTIAGRAPELQ
jgi:hypothetical protein